MTSAPRIKALLSQRVGELAPYLFPNGHREGHHWCVGSITGEPGRSFKICVSGDKACLWGDFDPSDNPLGKHSSNLLNLWMAARSMDFKTALVEAAAWTGHILHRSNGAAEVQEARSPTKVTPLLDWRACVQALTEKHIEQLAKWRAYSVQFCAWLRENGLVGLYDGCVAFPVNDQAGNVVACHYRLKDGSWRYYPQGARTRPLVIGELVAGDTVHVFESQWDAFAFMDVSGERHGIMITHGASNGAFITELVEESSTVYAWAQNDSAGEKWQTDICSYTRATVKRVHI